MFVFAQVNYTVTFQNNFEVFERLSEDGNMYTQIDWEGLENYSIEGCPVVPVKYIRLIIPYNKSTTSVNIIEDKAEHYKIGSFHIYNV